VVERIDPSAGLQGLLDQQVAAAERREQLGVNDPAKINAVDHPSHYGGKDNPYEAIKVIEAWNLGFNVGNAVKYISRAGKKGVIVGEVTAAAAMLVDLQKAAWYLNRAIENLKAGRDP